MLEWIGMEHPILLFDGECNFCRATVKWIAERDPRGVIHFAPLQSTPGKTLLREYGIPEDYVESVVFIEDGTAHLKSDAAMATLKYLDTPWKKLRVSRVFPRPLRDVGYEAISQNRPIISRVVGTIDEHWEPPPQMRDRFLATD